MKFGHEVFAVGHSNVDGTDCWMVGHSWRKCLSSRPTRARGGVLTCDTWTGTVDDSWEFLLYLLVPFW